MAGTEEDRLDRAPLEPSGDAWLGTALRKTKRTAALSRLVDRGEIAAVEVEDFGEPFYLPAPELSSLEGIQGTGGKGPKASGSEAAFLAPLDNLLWDRKLISKLFDFTYTWEVYTPVKQRRYGYYVLPVLCSGRFVARCEPVMDRETGTLIIKNWWWEPGVNPTPETKEALALGLREFCGFLGATSVSLPGGKF